MSNPNFPENLDIHPLVASETNKVFNFNAQKDAIMKYGIAGRVWEAAYLMNDYINHADDLVFDPPFFKEGQNIVIELGSGSGLVASNLAPALQPGRDTLILTDLPEVCPLLEENLRDLSGERPVHVFPLVWGNATQALFIHSQIPPSKALTHIVCSDLVYFPELLAPLLRTLIQLTSPPFATSIAAPTVLISYRVRSLSKETPFWSAFGLWFIFQPVLVRTVDQPHAWQRFGASLEDSTFVFAAHRRPGSFDWNVPERDEDLLAGVGATGSSDRKSDDTFETLLIMTVDNQNDEI